MRTVRFAALALGFVAVGLAPALAEPPFSFDRTPGKLPKGVVPSSYDISLRPDVAKFTFVGSETVRIRVRSATKTIAFNTLDMKVSRALLDGRAAASIATDNAKQITTLTFATPAAAGSHRLALVFAGKIGDQPQGLFYQKYSAPSGERVMLATQMESTDARRMFPSWDEPAFRATYKLTVTVPKSWDAVSNMPATSQTVSGATKTVSFARTPNMSTYLVAMCAGEFGYVSDTASDGVRIRVVAPKGREQQGRYALDAEKELLAYYDDYFGSKYPLPKLDLIAVPGGFPGAMENWGAITFNEQALLFDPSVEPESAKEGIYSTVAHEMAHQWMGDLVTMAWWDNLWLNEGFADWMQTKATAHFNPQWHLWERVNGDVEGAMGTDGLTTTHPVVTPITDETQANAAFDEITYQKGGAVVRMTEEYLGENTFRDGIRAYLKANAYSNTTSANLYAALSSASHQDVGAFANAWATEPGYPLVTADESCTDGKRSLTLKQQRFFYEPGQASDQLWRIPVAVAAMSSPQDAKVTLLSAKSATVATGGSCDEAAIVNAGATGYFRVAYDGATFATLQAAVEKLEPADRVRLLADTGASVTAGTVPVSGALDLYGKLDGDANLAVWEGVIGQLDSLSNMQVARPGEAAFDAYRIRLLRPVFDRLGWDGPATDSNVVSLRRNLLRTLGDAGDPQIVAEVRKRFAKYLTDRSSLPAELRGTVLAIVGTYADEATWNQLHALYKSAKSLEEGQIVGGALSQARDPALAKKNLAMATNGDIPPEAGPIAALFDIGTVATSARQPTLAWNFFKENESALVEHLSSFEKSLIVARFLPAFWNAAPAAELEAFAKSKMPPESAGQLKQAMNQVHVAAASADRVVPPLDQWVAANASGKTAVK
jgi:aminopeptidase N